MGVFGFDQDTGKSSIGISFALMKFVKVDDHFNDIIQEGEGELVVEDADSVWVLGLLNAEGSKFSKVECICPPIGLIRCAIHSLLIPGSKLWLVLDVGDSGQEGVMHNQGELFFGVDDIEFNKIGSLIQGGFKGL